MAPSDTMFAPVSRPLPDFFYHHDAAAPEPAAHDILTPPPSSDWEACVHTATDFDDWLQETFVEELHRPQEQHQQQLYQEQHQQKQQQLQQQRQQDFTLKRAAPLEADHPVKRMKMTPEHLARVVSKIDSRISKLQNIRQHILLSSMSTKRSLSCISPDSTTNVVAAFSTTPSIAVAVPRSAPTQKAVTSVPVSPVQRKTSALPGTAWNSSTFQAHQGPNEISASSSAASVSNGSSAESDSEDADETGFHLGNEDDSKLNRRAQNRVSAKRSRLKKKHHMDQMQQCLKDLKVENKKLRTFVEGKLGAATTQSMVQTKLAQKAAKGQVCLVALLKCSTSRLVDPEAMALLKNFSKTVASTS